MAPKIIFANSRCGSSRWHAPVASHNFIHHGIGSIPGSEFLKDDQWFIDFGKQGRESEHYNFLYAFSMRYLNTIKDRIWFLEDCRELGLEFTHKLKPKQMYRDNLIEWMLKFYKDWEIIRVCRRDNFRAGLSFVYQMQTNFKKSQYLMHHDSYEPQTEPFVVTNKDELVNYWKRNRQIENETWGKKIYNEDWNDKDITDWLEIPSDSIRHKKIPVDYEKLIINTDEVREWYDQFLQS